MVLTTIGLRHFNTIGERKNYISYTLAFSVCSDFDIYYIHVLKLTYRPVQEAAQKILEECKFTGIDGEYCSGDVNISLKTGTIIGTAGDAGAGIYGLDVGARDYRINGRDFANPDRYCRENERLVFERCYTVSAFDYYPDNVRSQLVFSGTPGGVNKGIIRTQKPLSGSVYQDVDGSAQGNWFKPGAQRSDIAPESNDLFLGSDNVKPETKVFSAGVSVQSLEAGRYSFKPESSGFVNRDFMDVKADGRTYCYDTAGNNGASAIIVRMLNATMLRIKGYGSACGSGAWDFGDACSDFER